MTIEAVLAEVAKHFGSRAIVERSEWLSAGGDHGETWSVGYSNGLVAEIVGRGHTPREALEECKAWVGANRRKLHSHANTMRRKKASRKR